MVLPAGAATAIDATNRAITQLFEAGISPVDGRDAVAWLREIEVLRRRIDAAATMLVGEIDRRELHADDGHASASVMARHVARVAGAEAAARGKTATACRHLPHLAQAWADGRIGSDQMHLLGRVYSNGRVAPAMVDRQDEFLTDATTMSARAFESKTRQWERLIDEDGPEPANERNHARRNAKMVQNPWDSSWDLTAFHAALQGVQMREVFDAYVDAEFQADWAEAKARLGDEVTKADLERSASQRRADALFRIFQDAAGSSGAVPPGFTHHIHWSQSAYEAMLASMEQNRRPTFDPDTFMCRSEDGHAIDPTEAAANSLDGLVARIRRLVVDASGVVIDLGRARRFTGSARTAATATQTCCVWPGCHTPLHACETDHLTEHSRNGPTCPGNGAPLCGKHNRWKQRGYTITRLPDGGWRTTRPDGSQLE